MRYVRWTSLIVATGLFLGCDRLGSKPSASQPAAEAAAEPGAASAQGQAPTGLTYPTDPEVCTRGVAVAANVPFYSGGAATSLRVQPALPAGLAFDPATGAISGTPTAVSPAAPYHVTAANSAGSTEYTLTIAVNDQAPGSAPVVTLPAQVTALKAGLAASTPDQGRGVTYAWTLTGGTLASGQGTPAITFTAGAAGTVTAAVTVGNSGGSLSGSAAAEIVPVPDASMTLPVSVRPGDTGFSASVTGQEGMTYLWTVVAGAANATITSGQGSTRIQLAAGRTPGTFQVQVKVQNQAGDSASASGTVKVDAGS